MSDYYKLMNNSGLHLKIALVDTPLPTQAISRCTDSLRIHVQMGLPLLLFKRYVDRYLVTWFIGGVSSVRFMTGLSLFQHK